MFFEKVAKLHENMHKMDDTDFGLALRYICKYFQKEIIGGTAVRKSSKIHDITDEFGKRLSRITNKEDYVNYTYFLAKVNQFEMNNRIDHKLRT